MADPIQAVQSATAADLTTFTANITILVAFLTAAVVGLRKGLKQFRDTASKNVTTSSDHKVMAATLMENITLHEWSQTNREVREALFSLRNAIVANTDEMKDLQRVIQLDMATRPRR